MTKNFSIDLRSVPVEHRSLIRKLRDNLKELQRHNEFSKWYEDQRSKFFAEVQNDLSSTITATFKWEYLNVVHSLKPLDPSNIPTENSLLRHARRIVPLTSTVITEPVKYK